MPTHSTPASIGRFCASNAVARASERSPICLLCLEAAHSLPSFPGYRCFRMHGKLACGRHTYWRPCPCIDCWSAGVRRDMATQQQKKSKPSSAFVGVSKVRAKHICEVTCILNSCHATMYVPGCQHLHTHGRRSASNIYVSAHCLTDARLTCCCAVQTKRTPI